MEPSTKTEVRIWGNMVLSYHLAFWTILLISNHSGPFAGRGPT